MVVQNLITRLGPDRDEECNLNASSIIQDMFEIKEFYNILCKKENVQTICGYACASMDQSTKASKTCALSVINQIISHHIEKSKKTGKKQDKENQDEDDDMIV